MVNGKMHLCYSCGNTIEEMLQCIQDTYDIADEIAGNLVVSYDTYPTSRAVKQKKKIVRLSHYNKKGNEMVLENRSITTQSGETRPLTMKDLTLAVYVARGTVVQEDTTCDSEFMLNVIEDIGKAIRAKFHWVSLDTPITLFMDNAGGHGTIVAKAQYIKILEEKYNVLITWQSPNSPETNILDLGVWMTIQSVVEWMHRQRGMNCESLARTVMEAWDAFSVEKLGKVATRWEKVLRLIIKGSGTNALVETERGLTATFFDPAEHPLFVNDVDATQGNGSAAPLGIFQM